MSITNQEKTMYYITEKDSETGKKFQAVQKKMKVARTASIELAEKYGFLARCNWEHAAAGGLYGLAKPEKQVDYKIWKLDNDGVYTPRKNTKTGKLIAKEIQSVPEVSRTELNKCIGYQEPNFEYIGFNLSTHEEYFGFSVNEEWKVKVPKDCKEVTTSVYREMFNN